MLPRYFLNTNTAIKCPYVFEEAIFSLETNSQWGVREETDPAVCDALLKIGGRVQEIDADDFDKLLQQKGGGRAKVETPMKDPVPQMDTLNEKEMIAERAAVMKSFDEVVKPKSLKKK